MTHRRTASLLLATLALTSATACGSEEPGSEAESKPKLNLPAAQPEGAQRTVGLLVSADQTSMVIKSQKGFETFIIRNEDRPKLGLDHLLSHAGSDVGFEVFYEPGEEEGVNYVTGARETAPPAGVTLEGDQ